MRRLLNVLLAVSLLALAACAAPPTDGARAATPAPQTTAPQPEPAATPAPRPAAGAPVKLDFSCRTDADCAVKDVGNCCGAKPACVNAGSPTDPEGVRAECARKGMMSICGFKPVEGCQCVQGQCKDKIAEVEAVH